MKSSTMYRICVVTFFMFFVNIVNSDWYENLKQKCFVETENYSNNFLAHIDDDEKVDKTFKCYMTCIYIGNGMLGTDGRMRIDTMNNSISSDWPERHELLTDWQNCGKESLASNRVEKCDVGFAFIQCFNQNLAERFSIARQKAKSRQKNKKE